MTIPGTPAPAVSHYDLGLLAASWEASADGWGGKADGQPDGVLRVAWRERSETYDGCARRLRALIAAGGTP